MKKRVVLDTNQIIEAGSRWLDPLEDVEANDARKLVKSVAKKHTGLYSSKIMAEYVEKLLDKKHPAERITKLIGLLMGTFELVQTTRTCCNPMPTDPDDAIFIICALDGNAHILVTNDEHLLDLKNRYNPPKIITQSDAIMHLCI
jgi:putative PIN family toxin of toxin-antitoxin system